MKCNQGYPHGAVATKTDACSFNERTLLEIPQCPELTIRPASEDVYIPRPGKGHIPSGEEIVIVRLAAPVDPADVPPFQGHSLLHRTSGVGKRTFLEPAGVSSGKNGRSCRGFSV